MEIFSSSAEQRLDNAFTPFEMTALETVSFFPSVSLSLLLNLFGSGHFISVAGKSVKDYWLFISTLLTSTDVNIHDFLPLHEEL